MEREGNGSQCNGKGLGGKEKVSVERKGMGIVSVENDGNSLGGKEMSLSGNGRE